LPELGGVAQTAHLGGEIAGAITGLTLLLMRRLWPAKDAGAATPRTPTGVLMPFLR
jgi:hypothetical protein